MHTSNHKLGLKKKKSESNVKYFFSIEDFPKFKILEDNYQLILEEVLEVMNENKSNTKITKKNNEHIQENSVDNNSQLNNNSSSENNNKSVEENKDQLFQPWVEKVLYQESNEDGWDVAPLMIGGEVIEETCRRFPKLYELVKNIEGVVSVSFSLLKPGTHIIPHKGYDDYSEKVLRYHLGIIVPEGDVAIRVERDIRKWENGKSFVFDDYNVHEAWNMSGKNRLVLIIDFLKENAFTDPNSDVKFSDNNFNNSIKGYLKN